MSDTESGYIACPYCDTLYNAVIPAEGERIYCSVCNGLLDRGVADFRKSFIFALTAVILFIIANTFPFISIELAGQERTIMIFSSISGLFDNGLNLLAILVFFLIVITPLWYLLGVVWVVLSFRLNWCTAMTRHFLHWMTRLSPWNMIEVYLVGVLVMVVKISQMAAVHFDYGFWSFVALMVCSVLTSYYFHPEDATLLAEQHDA